MEQVKAGSSLNIQLVFLVSLAPERALMRGAGKRI